MQVNLEDIKARLPKFNIKFIVNYPPTPQKRHRDRRGGGKYDPSSQQKKDFLILCLQYAPKELPTCAVELTIDFMFKRPKSHYRTGKFSKILKENAPDYHKQVPDLDNLVKFIKDAFKGVFWKDDSQVFLLRARKHWNTSQLETYKACIGIGIRYVG